MEKFQLIEESLKSVNSSPVECLNEVLKLICETAGCEYGAILTLDGNRSVFALDALYGYRSDEALELRSARLKFPIEQGWVAAISLQEGRNNELVSPIVKQIAEPGQFPIIPADVKEVLAYPVSSMDEYIAVLTLGSTSAGAFDEVENSAVRLEMLRVGSNLISVALASRQSLIFKLDEFIKFGKFENVTLMSKAIVRWVLNTFKMDSCALFFVEYDETTDKEYLYCKERIVSGQPELNVKDIRYSKGEDYCGWVMENRACLILTDFEEGFSKELESYERRYASLPRRTDHSDKPHPTLTFKSYLGIPIIDAGRVIGVLEVLDTERGYAFSDEGLLEMIGQRIAYEYNRMLENRRKENLFAIPSIEERDFDKVVDEVVTAAMKVAAATHGFFLYKESQNVFIAKAIKGHALKESDIPPVRLDEPSLVNYVLQSRDAFIIQDIEKERNRLSPEIQRYLNDGPSIQKLTSGRFKSLLMVPIYEPVAGRPAGEANMEDVGTGKELGVLVLMSSRPSPFKQDELIITALAEIVGLHIWGNRRLAELDYDRQQVAQLRQAAQNSQQAIFGDDVFEIIFDDAY
jgi:GAF domain-containing protein